VGEHLHPVHDHDVAVFAVTSFGDVSDLPLSENQQVVVIINAS
jgi:hypothetical protein